VDVPRRPDGAPLLPDALWRPLDPAVQAVLVVVAGQVEALTAEVRELRARVGQTSATSSRPPSGDPPQARRPGRPPSGRARGGQPGHVAHQRLVAPPARVDAIIQHRPQTCAHCAAPLAADAPSAGFVAHQVTEVPRVRAVVSEHRLHRLVCPACGQPTRAALPAAVPTGAFGPRLQATVAVLRGQYRLSQRQAADVCGTLLDAPLAAGSVAGLCRATAAALEGPVAVARATLPTARVVNADETHWPRPQAGRRHWLWVAVTRAATVFTLAASRGSAVIKGLLGADYRGVVGSDRYSAYAWLDETCRQVCWAHLKRDFAGLVDRGGASKEVGTAALALVHNLFAGWHRFRDGQLDRAALAVELQPVQDALDALLEEGLAGAAPTAAGLCRALDRLWPALWTFVDAPGVEPTNNAAERALRPAVLWRKGSYGTQSDGGDRFVEGLLTVTATCRQHGRSVLDYLTAVCTATQRGLSPPALLPTATA
jgi:transposase